MRIYYSIFMLVVLATSLLSSSVANALSVDYNNIIDDRVFDNSTSMTAQQIDDFLNTFPNSCISTRNGFSTPDLISYSVKTGYVYGTDVSAGTAIYHAAQAYGINPQVLLTTLEKEQGLVVGAGGNVSRPTGDPTDCGSLAFSAAVGYNCPDSLKLTSYNGFVIYAHTGPGSASQNGTVVTGVGTAFSSTMVGNQLVFPDGTRDLITQVNSPTSLTTYESRTVAQQTYRVQAMYVNSTCVEHAAYVGFSRQLIIAAWQFTFDRHRSEGINNWYANAPNWDNSDDLGTCYSHKTIQGGPFYLCPDQVGHSSDPYVSHSGQYPIDTIVVTITNGATAALLNYTPHTHGQDLFVGNFTNWFGSTHAALAGNRPSYQSLNSHSPCNIPAFSSTYVGRLYQPDTQDFLYTTNQNEACAASTYGYIWEGIVFKNIASTETNAIPVYRLANIANHVFISSSTDRNTYLTQYGYHDEGIAFYVYSASAANTLPVTKLTDVQATFILTSAASESTYYQDVYKFSSLGTVFYTPDLAAGGPNSLPGSTPVYRLSKNNQRLYTTSSLEQSQAVNNYGYSNEDLLANADNTPNTNNTPVYRLRSPNGSYLFTINRTERDLAVINYNYIDEGSGFYALRYSSKPIYRLTNYGAGLRLFTNSSAESNQATATYGYKAEGLPYYGY